MLNKWILGAALAVQSMVYASPAMLESEEQCLGSCQITSEDSAYGEVAHSTDGKWYCIAKSGCGETFIPECGNPCFSHAVKEAIALCNNSIPDADKDGDGEIDDKGCKVVAPDNGSCSQDREALVRKSKVKK